MKNIMNSNLEFQENKNKFYKETFAWPILSGLIVYSYKEPCPNLMAIIFILSIYIFVGSKNKEKICICIAFIVFQLINAKHILYGQENINGPLFTLPNLWVANRILYVVGLGIFIPPLLEINKNSQKIKNLFIYLGFIFLFLAFATNLHERKKIDTSSFDCKEIIDNKCTLIKEPESWYSVANLLDDTLVGSSAAALFFGLSEKQKQDSQKKYTRPLPFMSKRKILRLKKTSRK